MTSCSPAIVVKEMGRQSKDVRRTLKLSGGIVFPPLAFLKTERDVHAAAPLRVKIL